MEMKERFDSSGWRVSVEETFKAQHDLAKATGSKMHRELWRGVKAEKWRYYEIRGKFGMVYPYSDHQLAAYTQSTRIAKRLAAMKEADLFREGEWNPTKQQRAKGERAWREFVYRLPPSMLDQAAALIQAGKKRVHSPETRKKLANVLDGRRNKRKLLSGSLQTGVKTDEKVPNGSGYVGKPN